jgi:hypothetical protein
MNVFQAIGSRWGCAATALPPAPDTYVRCCKHTVHVSNHPRVTRCNHRQEALNVTTAARRPCEREGPTNPIFIPYSKKQPLRGDLTVDQEIEMLWKNASENVVKLVYAICFCSWFIPYVYTHVGPCQCNALKRCQTLPFRPRRIAALTHCWMHGSVTAQRFVMIPFNCLLVSPTYWL